MSGNGTSTTMPLAGDFPPQSHEAWQTLVAGVVNKSRAEDAKLTPDDAEASLRTSLPGGLTIDPLYLAPAEAAPLGFPAPCRSPAAVCCVRATSRGMSASSMTTPTSP